MHMFCTLIKNSKKTHWIELRFLFLCHNVELMISCIHFGMNFLLVKFHQKASLFHSLCCIHKCHVFASLPLLVRHSIYFTCNSIMMQSYVITPNVTQSTDDVAIHLNAQRFLFSSAHVRNTQTRNERENPNKKKIRVQNCCRVKALCCVLSILCRFVNWIFVNCMIARVCVCAMCKIA